MKNIQQNPATHLADALIAAYAIGKCSLDEQAAIDEHCFTCEQCRTRLSIMLRVCAADEANEGQSQLERLFPLGIETIAQARKGEASPISHFSVRQQEHVPAATPSRPPLSRQHQLRTTFAQLVGHRGYQFAVLLLIAALAAGLFYWRAASDSPLHTSILAMKRSYRFSRPLEARVTGGFAYQPYERKRGDAITPDVDRDQINYALAELTRAVASHPTADTRHALGRLYLLLGEFDKAEEQMISALKDSSGNARLHTDLAALYYERSKYADAAALLLKAVEHYDSAISIEPSLAEAWFNRALCYEQMSLFNQASKDWEKYLSLDPNSSWAKEARERLKKIQARSLQSNKTSKSIKLALEKAAELKDEAALHNLVDQNFVAVKEFGTGQIFDQYLSATTTDNGPLAELYLQRLKLIAELLSKVKGDAYLKDLTDFASRASPNVLSGIQGVRLMLRQADDAFDRSSHDVAFKFYQSAYEKAGRIGDQPHAELAALGLFRYYNIRNKSPQLAALGARVLTQAEETRHVHNQAKAHLATANSYLISQQPDLALEHSLKGLEIFQQLNDDAAIINTLRMSSAAYSRMGNYEQALKKDFALLSRLREEPGSPLTVVAYQQAGETLFQLNNFSVAYCYQEEALQIATTINNPLFLVGSEGRLGTTLWKLGRYEEASAYLNNAVSHSYSVSDQTSRQLLQIELYTILGNVSLAQKNVEEAIEFYHQAIKVSVEINNQVYLSTIHQGLATAYLQQGKLAKAEAELQLGISLAERDRLQIKDASSRGTFLASRQSVYRSMINLQFTAKQAPVEAFNYAEIAKGRDLLDALSERPIVQRKDGRIVLTLSGGSRPLTLQQIQGALSPSQQLLSYSVVEKKILMWLVTSTELFTANVDYDTNLLQKEVAQYLSDLRARNEVEVINLQAANLYRVLIAPIANKLDPKRSLCIIPDDFLYQIPFPALLSPESNRYLIEDFSLFINPSATAVIKAGKLLAKKHRNEQETFMGVSNPKFNHRRFPGLPVLPSTNEEVTQASSLYPKRELFNQESATESALTKRLGDYDIVHIASHILINGQAPLLSAILLAQESDDGAKEKLATKITADAMLQAQEIYQLKLQRTKLVVLSGCRSALGDVTRGEALGQLAQSFFAADVPAVVASLWEVDDESTAQVMYSFHYQHQVEHKTFGDALASAQRLMIHSDQRRLRHPYYWAAFLLAGSSLTR